MRRQLEGKVGGLRREFEGAVIRVEQVGGNRIENRNLGGEFHLQFVADASVEIRFLLSHCA